MPESSSVQQVFSQEPTAQPLKKKTKKKQANVMKRSEISFDNNAALQICFAPDKLDHKRFRLLSSDFHSLRLVFEPIMRLYRWLAPSALLLHIDRRHRLQRRRRLSAKPGAWEKSAKTTSYRLGGKRSPRRAKAPHLSNDCGLLAGLH